ncbi:MAG: Re/Si-specific NAD(P)(+) transhydrogenase subunit alpha [Gammaproteobacteria bacterium]|nr:Re/Si-specific NAD(P)(+) transhydrogenase subunit alpha [Gammaproteobacteria bacterium]
MKVAVPKERREGETRVAASPETVKKFVQMGLRVFIESGAGINASFLDETYAEAGAYIAASAQETLSEADVVLKVRPADQSELALMKSGAHLIGMLEPYDDLEGARRYAEAGVDAFCMELVPRITRAQSMDVLSSQSNLAGYRSVIDAAGEFTRAMPMMMTAAGTVPPARVLVMGAGVAGLQAIATAKRLGAIVSATDVRPVAKEQVESLGAKFVTVESEEMAQAETAGGYAKEMSDEYKAAQAQLIAQTLTKQDIVICTALIPGRPAPTLIDDAMVASMRPGSVIVDLAVERGGNCTLSQPGKTIAVNGVKILGHVNVAGRLAVDASALYAKNLYAFLIPHVEESSKQLNIDWDDEIIAATALTRNGQIIHPQFKA